MIYLEIGVNLFDIVLAFDGQQIVALGKPARMLDPGLVSRFPVAKSSITTETFDMIARSHVEKSSFS